MVKKKGGLNRGLNAFINDKNKVENILKPKNDLEVKEINLEDIIVNKDQPRKTFNDESLRELANSIEEHGIIQPILVRQIDDKYEIIAGERRFRASKLLGKSTISAIIKDISDYEQESLSLIENVQREDLNPYEEALAYKSIIDNYKMTQDELAKALGKSRPYISNTVRLLRLDNRVLELLKEGQISYSIGRELLSISDGDEQYKKALEIVEKGSTVKDITKQKKRKRRQKPTNFHLVEVEETFMDKLGTKVRIDEDKKVISINYYDNEDLQRIIEIIAGE